MQYKYLGFYRLHLLITEEKIIDYPNLKSQSQVPVLVRQAQWMTEAEHCETKAGKTANQETVTLPEWSSG